MNIDILSRTGELFPKYHDINSFLLVYPHYKNLSIDEKNQYLHFANYINVTLRLITSTNNEKHIVPIGLRIVAGRGEEYITGGGKTDKTKRRTEILKTESNEPSSTPPFQTVLNTYEDLNDIDFKLFIEDFAVKMEDEMDIELKLQKSKEYPRTIAGVNIITNVLEKSTEDGSINISLHETRVDNGDASTTISRSVSLVEKWKEGDDRFDDEISQLFHCDSLQNGVSLSTNLSRNNNFIVKTTSINLKNNLNTEAILGQKRAMDNAASRSTSESDFPQIMRSISESSMRDPEEFELMRATSDVSDLVLNHLNMANLTDDIFAMSSLDLFSFDHVMESGIEAKRRVMDPDAITREIIQDDDDNCA
jgi:hypothetical protein